MAARGPHHCYVGRGESERGWAGEKERNEMEVTEREAAVVERELGGIGGERKGGVHYEKIRNERER